MFLDELNAAPAMVQAACYQLVLDRRLGEYSLSEQRTIIGAGNRDSDRAVTARMPRPLRNRFVHLDFEVDAQEWSEWAIQAAIRREVIAFHGKSSHSTGSHRIPREVIAFLRFRPEVLSMFDRDATAFPSPRSKRSGARRLPARSTLRSEFGVPPAARRSRAEPAPDWSIPARTSPKRATFSRYCGSSQPRQQPRRKVQPQTLAGGNQIAAPPV